MATSKTKVRPDGAAGEAQSGLSWLDAGGGYFLALNAEKKVFARKGDKQLASVPKALKEGEVAERLAGLADWLVEHERESLETVERWMLRSLPVPRAVLEAVFPDPVWKDRLLNAVVAPIGPDGPVPEEAGFLRDVDSGRGIGVVNLDGETSWLRSTSVAIPHPILLLERDDFRELATELSFKQGLSQLFRETYAIPAGPELARTSLDDLSGGEFEKLQFALGRCRTLGYRVRGGFATTSVWEGDRVVEARYWVGSDDPEAPTITGDLAWLDAREKMIPLAEVGPVAFSEGLRMASAIYAGRKVEKEGAPS